MISSDATARIRCFTASRNPIVKYNDRVERLNCIAHELYDEEIRVRDRSGQKVSQEMFRDAERRLKIRRGVSPFEEDAGHHPCTYGATSRADTIQTVGWSAMADPAEQQPKPTNTSPSRHFPIPVADKETNVRLAS